MWHPTMDPFCSEQTFCRFQYLPAQVLQLCHRTHQNPSKKRTFCAFFHLRLKLPRISALFCNCLSCYETSARSCARDDEDFAINTRQLFLEGWRESWGLVPFKLTLRVSTAVVPKAKYFLVKVMKCPIRFVPFVLGFISLVLACRWAILFTLT